MTRKYADPNTAVIYARVSTGKQAISIADQVAKAEEYCTWRGLRVERVVTDEAVSGGDALYSRPGGVELMEALAHAGTVVVLKIDRLFRDTADALLTVKAWNRQGTTLHIVDFGGQAINTATPEGMLIFTTLVAFATFEREVGGVRTGAGLARRRSLGMKWCRDAYGVDMQPGEARGSHVRVNKREQAVIARIRQLREGGESYAAIAEALNSEGVRTKRQGRWHPSTVRGILERCASLA